MDKIDETVKTIEEVDKMLESINEKINEKEKNNIEKEKILQDIDDLINNLIVE